MSSLTKSPLPLDYQTHDKNQYYLLFIFWDIFEFIFIYFFFVETRRRTLEEISDIFNAKKPVKHSLNKTSIMVHGNGRGVTEMLDKEERVIERDFATAMYGHRRSSQYGAASIRDSGASQGELIIRDELREKVMDAGRGSAESDMAREEARYAGGGYAGNAWREEREPWYATSPVSSPRSP